MTTPLRLFPLVSCAAAALAVATLGPIPARAHHTAASADMSDAAMARALDAWYAVHPRVGGTAAASGARALGEPVASFLAVGTTFDLDANAGTVIDTAKIATGETVRIRWGNGIHTVTSGEGSKDPNMGMEFDVTLTTNNRTFDHAYPAPGTYPFFCAIHEGFSMKGVVVVSDPVGVPPLSGGQGIGFAAGPWPNPSAEGIQFRFALAGDGRVRADIVDARGRFVAVITDRAYPGGTHGAAWDGRTAGGRRASAGTYYLRLHLPGFSGGRSFVLKR